MDQSRAPILEALADYHAKGRYGFSPLGHRQGRGADERTLAVLGREPFHDDILASGGLDDRRSRNGYLSAAVDKNRLGDCADLLMTTSPNVIVYAAIDGWRRQMVQRGHKLLGAALALADDLRERIGRIPDVEVLDSELLGEQASHDLDRLQILIDVSATGTSGYQAVDWLREHCHIDLGESDHRRMLATMSFADGKDTGDRLVEALTAWRTAADDFDGPPQVDLPTPDEIQLETVRLPRDAFFGPTEMVPADKASGRVAAEQLTPYPPGIPAVVPGERLNQAVVDYLRSGLKAGMGVPDASDSKLGHFKVVA